jgi:hypothetical protein
MTKITATKTEGKADCLPSLLSSGVPMTEEQLRVYLQNLYNIPVAIRQEGTYEYKCPYCECKHTTDRTSGHHAVECAEDDRYQAMGLSIGDRSFVPAYGVTLFSFLKDEGVNRLILPDNLAFSGWGEIN